MQFFSRKDLLTFNRHAFANPGSQFRFNLCPEGAFMIFKILDQGVQCFLRITSKKQRWYCPDGKGIRRKWVYIETKVMKKGQLRSKETSRLRR